MRHTSCVIPPEKPAEQTGRARGRALASSHKWLLTATPLQNSLIELYGISTMIDEHLLGDVASQCKAQGATQTEYAALCGVGVRFISELENGKPARALGKVLQVLQGLQPLGLRDLQATELAPLQVVACLRKAMLPKEFLDRHPGIRLAQETEDLFLLKTRGGSSLLNLGSGAETCFTFSEFL